jgi:PIN domain nuclease of toxin-antitoxin system
MQRYFLDTCALIWLLDGVKRVKDISYDLPFFPEHKDQTDRNIIVHAIADNRILISGDENFYLYEDSGLKFLEV